MQKVWDSYKELLIKSHNDKKWNEAWDDLWANDSQFVVKYGKKGKDGYEEEIFRGRDEIVEFFKGGIKKIGINFKDVGFFCEMTNEPNTFVVISDFSATIIESKYPYKNRIVCQVILDRQGKIRVRDWRFTIGRARPLATLLRRTSSATHHKQPGS